MKIFLIRPVRGITPEMEKRIEESVARLEGNCIEVYDPYRDTEQDDPVGLNICLANLKAISEADEVHIAGTSPGCIFDFGMAFALRKKIKVIEDLFPMEELNSPNKCFAKVMKACEDFERYLRDERRWRDE